MLHIQARKPLTLLRPGIVRLRLLRKSKIKVTMSRSKSAALTTLCHPVRGILPYGLQQPLSRLPPLPLRNHQRLVAKRHEQVQDLPLF